MLGLLTFQNFLSIETFDNGTLGIMVVFCVLLLFAPFPVTEFPAGTRFVQNGGSYFVFLLLLSTLNVIESHDQVHNIPLESLLAYWLFDICYAEFVQFLNVLRKNTSSAPRNDTAASAKSKTQTKKRKTIFSTCIKAIAKLLKSLRQHFDDPWNIYDFISLATAALAAMLRARLHFSISNGSTNTADAIFGNQLFGWALVFLWGRH